jgi:hypothetical protein
MIEGQQKGTKMSYRLQRLDIALTALCLIGAWAAGAAFAKYDSQVPKTWLHGTNTTHKTFSTNPGTITCKKATSSGVEVGTEVEPGIYTASTIKFSTTLSECTAFGFPAEVKSNGCEVEYLEPISFKAATKILCPTGKQIEIVAIGFCTMTIGAQSPGGSVAITNEGTGSAREIVVSSSVTGITYGGNCGSGTNGTSSGGTRIKGFSDQALTHQVGIWTTG